MRGNQLSPSGVTKLVTAALFALLGVGFIVFEFVDDEATGVAAVFGVFNILLGYWLYRNAVPRRTRDFAITATPDAVTRGGTISVTLAIPDTTKVGAELEVGLVCTEYYDVEVPHAGTTSPGPQTREAPAHEEWRPADPTATHQSHTFTVPAEAPFTHHGKCLHYQWRAVAREPERLRVDSRSEQVVKVEP